MGISGKHIIFQIAIALFLLIALTACTVSTPMDVAGSGAEQTPGTSAPSANPTDVPPSPTPLPATATAIPPTPTPSLAIDSLEDVGEATLRIEAVGSFVDPEEGMLLNEQGSGSGFIIDESGIAVTNNHVVTGAAFLKVYVDDDPEPRNAKILGVSECSDLAVIDLEGDGYRYLEWYDGPINVGLDVYAAGFPLGDPEFTLTKGIISKARADGESDWSSIDYVIEHDATIQPGNSGGPLVTEDGQVVGVNYATSYTDQYYAISENEALEIIDRLRDDEDVDSIGINGVAMYDGDVFGIWVASVASGSPADRAGIKGGDMITKMEGLALADDGTMADYCDILRTHDPQDDTLTIEVVRFDTGEVLEGQINGRELQVSESFADRLSEETQDSADTYGEYVLVNDDSETIVLEVPVEWDDIDGTPWEMAEGLIGPSIVASSNLDAFYETWETPGVFFGAVRMPEEGIDEQEVLDSMSFDEECVYDDRYNYSDALYTGLYDLYTDCNGSDASLVNIVAVPEDRSFIIVVQVQVVADQDLDALDHIISTFEVIGDLP